MVVGETYEMPALTLTHLWGGCNMEAIGMRHSSSNKRGGYRATAEAKHLFGWPKNLSKKETARRVTWLRKQVVDGNYNGLTWEYPIPLMAKKVD